MKCLATRSFSLCFSVLAWAGEMEDLERALHHELHLLCMELNIPGATASFVLEEGRFGEVAVGVADRETCEAMTPESRMPAASIGKTLVGACALTLEAESRLDLDAPISCWLGEEPWFSRLPGNGEITVRHLLNHSSGLPDHVYLDAFRTDLSDKWHEEKNAFTPEVLVGYVLDRPALFPPGEGWSYSDTGYVLLGMVIGRAAGQSVADMVEERFLIPLHLPHTQFADTRELPGLVPGYTTKSNPFGFPEKSVDREGRLYWHPALENYGGGWISSSGDLARWGNALFAGAALPETARPELRRRVPTTADINAPQYGPGVSFLPRSPLGPSWGHRGWIPGYISSMRHFSWMGLTIAFQLNTDDIQAAEDENWISGMELRLADALLKTCERKELSEYE